MYNASPTEQLRPPPDPDRWLELVEAESTEVLKAELQDHHPADIAAVLEQLPNDIIGLFIYLGIATFFLMKL